MTPPAAQMTAEERAAEFANALLAGWGWDGNHRRLLAEQVAIVILAAEADARRPLEQRIAELEEEAKEHDASFDLRWKSDIRAIEMWQAEKPGRRMMWPSHDDLCVWLMRKIDALADARRAGQEEMRTAAAKLLEAVAMEADFIDNADERDWHLRLRDEILALPLSPSIVSGRVAMIQRDAKGFYVADCPVCNQKINVTSLPDDTRRRFCNHRQNGELNHVCVMSGELVPSSPAVPRCKHERLNEEGICRACGEDCRGTHS